MLSAAATRGLALALLAVLAAVLATFIARWLARSDFTPSQAILATLNRFVAHLLWNAEISGALPLPPGQGAVIVCNHRSPVDPAFIALATGRVVHWMVAKEYSLHPSLAWLFRLMGTIPVGRGGIDIAAARTAIRLARDGELVGIFPEGRLNRTKRLLLPGRPGAALIALEARVPVIPCYIHGSPYRGAIWTPFIMPARVRLRVGQPLDISEFYGRQRDRELIDLLTRKFLQEIARLAGQPDFRSEMTRQPHFPAEPSETDGDHAGLTACQTPPRGLG